MTMNFSRRAALAGLFAATAAPALAQPRPAALTAADQALVDKAVAYLQSLDQAKGRFLQTDARGRTSTGDIYLKRPGRVRFAYDPPVGLLVVSNGAQVNVQDSRLKTFESYPLSATPLALFLAREIRLDRGVQVTSVRRYADGFSLTARDLRKETAGQISLVFSDNPMALREWTIVDAQGQTTRVGLSGLTRVGALSPDLFILRDPRPRGGGRR